MAVARQILANICRICSPTVFSGKKLINADPPFTKINRSMKFLSFLGPLNLPKISPKVISDKIAAEKKKYERWICNMFYSNTLKVQKAHNNFYYSLLWAWMLQGEGSNLHEAVSYSAKFQWSTLVASCETALHYVCPVILTLETRGYVCRKFHHPTVVKN